MVLTSNLIHILILSKDMCWHHHDDVIKKFDAPKTKKLISSFLARHFGLNLYIYIKTVELCDWFGIGLATKLDLKLKLKVSMWHLQTLQCLSFQWHSFGSHKKNLAPSKYLFSLKKYMERFKWKFGLFSKWRHGIKVLHILKKAAWNVCGKEKEPIHEIVKVNGLTQSIIK